MPQVPQQTFSALQVPVNIEQMAITYQLGMPGAKYQTEKLGVGVAFGLLSSIVGAFFVFLVGLFYVFSYQIWWVLLPVSFCLLIPLLIIRAILSSFHPIEVFVCPEGLIYSRKKRLEVIRWDYVEAYWEDVQLSSSDDDSFDYRLQRNDGTTFEFPNAIENIRRLGSLVKQNVDQHLLARAITTYHAGTPVPFSDMSIYQQAIRVENGRKILRWEDFDSFNLDQEKVDIYRKGQEHAWYRQRVVKIANPGVLRGLLDHIVQQRVRQQLPQAIASYKMGTPVVFGRISFILQGIAIDGGKKVLPWRDVKKVNVDIVESKVSIYSHSKLLSWQTFPTWMVSDTFLLKELTDYLLQEHMHRVEAQVQGQLPQMLASYQAGIPLTFGRITLSLQGVAIDGGKQSLPWSEVSNLYIGAYIGGERLTVVKKDKLLAWQALPISQLGDVEMLKRLIEHILSTRP